MPGPPGTDEKNQDNKAAPDAGGLPLSRSERNNLLFETCPFGVFRTSPEGKLLEGNVALMRMFGYEDNGVSEHFTGRDLASEVYADPGRREELVRMVLASEGPVCTEGLFLRRDGSLMVCHLHIWAVRGSLDEVLYLEGIMQDVSGSRRAEENLRNSEERFRALFEASLVGVVMFDDAGRVVDANPATLDLVGYTLEEARSMSLVDFMPKDKVGEAEHLWRGFLEKGSGRGEAAVVRKDGALVQVEYEAVAECQPGLHISFWRPVDT